MHSHRSRSTPRPPTRSMPTHAGCLLLAGCCLAGSAAALAAEAGAGQGAEAAVREVVELYAQGTYEGDAAKLIGPSIPRR